jgi:hypothetical protein
MNKRIICIIALLILTLVASAQAQCVPACTGTDICVAGEDPDTGATTYSCQAGPGGGGPTCADLKCEASGLICVADDQNGPVTYSCQPIQGGGPTCADLKCEASGLICVADDQNGPTTYSCQAVPGTCPGGCPTGYTCVLNPGTGDASCEPSGGATPNQCGNFRCESGENANDCPNDCGCMDHDLDNPTTASYVNYLSPLGMQVVQPDQCSMGGSELTEWICQDKTQSGSKVYLCSSLGPNFVCQTQEIVTSQGKKNAGMCADSTSTNPPVMPTKDVIAQIVTVVLNVACMVYCLIIVIFAGIASLALMFAGMTYMTSQDPSDRSEARRRIGYIVIGIVIVVLACPIINILFSGTIIAIGGVGPCTCQCASYLGGG